MSVMVSGVIVLQQPLVFITKKLQQRYTGCEETDLDIHFGDRHLSGGLPLKFTVGHFVCSFQSDHELAIGHRVYGQQDVSVAHISQCAIATSLGAGHSYKADVSYSH